jgi:rod shape-determining protein MreD
MLAVVRHVLYLALVFVLQTTWLHHVQIGNILPDLVLLVVVFVALLSGHLEATLLGFLVGLCQDAYSPPDLGLNALAKSLVGFAVGIGRGGFIVDAIQVQVAVLIVAVLAHDLVYYVGASSTTMGEVPYLMLRFSLGRALYTGALGLLVAWVLRLRRDLIPA